MFYIIYICHCDELNHLNTDKGSKVQKEEEEKEKEKKQKISVKSTSA